MHTKLNLGSGKNYLSNYVNVDITHQWNPDLVLDLSKPINSTTGSLPLDHFEEILATDVLEHVTDLVQLMTNLLELLKDGGIVKVSVPYDLSLGAWQDPTHVRAFNENSWLYYTDWFWYLGWTNHRFDLTSSFYSFSAYGQQLNSQGKTLEELLRTPRAIDAMSVVLTKRSTTPEERATAFARRSRV
jgi:SAM-dependent methyltransferase